MVDIFVIVVYDVGVKRVNKLKASLRQYLNWIQNSVFEGELTESEYRAVVKLVEAIILKSHDHLVIYSLNDRKYIDRKEYGTPKLDNSNII